MAQGERLLVCQVGGRLVGFGLEGLERVEAAVEISALPRTPLDLLGVVNYHGEIMPVVDLRPSLGERREEVALSDRLVVMRGAESGRVAVLVSRALGVFEVDMESERVEALAAAAEFRGTALVEDKVVLLASDALLSPEARGVLEEFLRSEASRGGGV